MKLRKSHISSANKAIISIAFFAIALMIIIRWNGYSGENYRNIIRSDGYGYYDYFPMLFGENAISDQKPNGVYLLKTSDGKTVNKYFVGTALMQSPFVLPLISAKSLFNQELDLHSEVFQKVVSIAALVYLLFGLMFVVGFLKLFDIKDHIIGFSLFAVFFGTNLLYYSVLDPSMSHVYSFAIISGFLYYSKKLTLKFTPKDFILSVLFLALVILIRPINVLIVFILPFVFGDKTNIKNIFNNIYKYKVYSIIAFIIFIITLSLQLIVWKLQTGDFIVWSYANEGFYFTHPAILQFVFSMRKGLFVYTPFVLVGILLFSISYLNRIKLLAKGLGFIFILVYVLSSWWNWYYGDSYGSRVIIDYLAVFVMFFSLGISNVKPLLQKVSVIVVGIFIALNLMQSYQYYHNIMSHFDMNAEKYKYIFGKFGDKYENCLGANDDIVSYHKNKLTNLIDYNIDFKDNDCKYLRISTKVIGNKKVLFDANEYGLSFIFNANLFYDYRESYVELQNTIKLVEGNLSQVFWTITYIDSVANVYNYQKIKINVIPAFKGVERIDNYRIRLHKPLMKNDLIQISLWNYSKSKFELSNLKLKISGITE